MTRYLSLLLCTLSSVVGCDHDVHVIFSDAFTSCVPSDGGVSHDMSTTPTPCAAAKGLPGVPLVCTDFSSVGDQILTNPPPTQLSGWNFEKFDKSCWQILSGKLQVQNFPNFMSNCGFLMPTLSPSDYQKYGSFTLSVIQTVDLNKQKQTALIYLGLDQDTQQLATSTGTNPRQRNIYEVAKAALPNGGGTSYQPLFKITSILAGGATGWQLESIAVMGNP